MRGGRGSIGRRSVSSRRYVGRGHRHRQSRHQLTGKPAITVIIIFVLLSGTPIGMYAFEMAMGMPIMYLLGAQYELDPRVFRPLDVFFPQLKSSILKEPVPAIDARIKLKIPDSLNMTIFVFDEQPSMIPWESRSEEENFTIKQGEYQYFVRFFNKEETFSVSWSSDGTIEMLFFDSYSSFSSWTDDNSLSPSYEAQGDRGRFSGTVNSSDELYFVFQYSQNTDYTPINVNAVFNYSTLRGDPADAIAVYHNDSEIPVTDSTHVFLQNNEVFPVQIRIEKDMKTSVLIFLVATTIVSFLALAMIIRKARTKKKVNDGEGEKRKVRPDPKYCPRCSKPILPSDRFCENCGKQLQD